MHYRMKHALVLFFTFPTFVAAGVGLGLHQEKSVLEKTNMEAFKRVSKDTLSASSGFVCDETLLGSRVCSIATLRESEAGEDPRTTDKSMIFVYQTVNGKHKEVDSIPVRKALVGKTEKWIAYNRRDIK